MTKSAKTLEFRSERTIPASPGEVYDAWLNPKIPGNPWNAAEKFGLDPKVDGLFYWTLKGDVPLRPVHGDRAAGPHSAYLGVTKHIRRGVDYHSDLQDREKTRYHDPRAFRPSRYGPWTRA
jgi:hypothetical protein